MRREENIDKRNEDSVSSVKNNSFQGAKYSKNNHQLDEEDMPSRNRVSPSPQAVRKRSMEIQFIRGAPSDQKSVREQSAISNDRVVFPNNATFSSRDDHEYTNETSFQNPRLNPVNANTRNRDPAVAPTTPAYRSKNVTICLVISVLLGCGLGAGIGFGVYSIVNKTSSSSSTFASTIVDKQAEDQSSSYDSTKAANDGTSQQNPSTNSRDSSATTAVETRVEVNSPRCGVLNSSSSSNDRVARIVGGDRSVIAQHPWQASLWTTGHLCGGSIIASNWILSAAHCTSPFPKPSEWTVYVGETDRYQMPVTAQVAQVTDVITHESYDEDSYENDISLLRLNAHFKLNSNVQTICLPTPAYRLPRNETCEITGWGAIEEEGDPAQILQKASVDMIDLDICNSDDWLSGLVLDNMFCAGTNDGSRDACQGDSGGPLTCYNEQEAKFYLVGAVSWGIGCGEPRMPGVYTNVSQYFDWINNSINETESRHSQT